MLVIERMRFYVSSLLVLVHVLLLEGSLFEIYYMRKINQYDFKK